MEQKRGEHKIKGDNDSKLRNKKQEGLKKILKYFKHRM